MGDSNAATAAVSAPCSRLTSVTTCCSRIGAPPAARTFGGVPVVVVYRTVVSSVRPGASTAGSQTIFQSSPSLVALPVVLYFHSCPGANGHDTSIVNVPPLSPDSCTSVRVNVPSLFPSPSYIAVIAAVAAAGSVVSSAAACTSSLFRASANCCETVSGWSGPKSPQAESTDARTAIPAAAFRVGVGRMGL